MDTLGQTSHKCGSGTPLQSLLYDPLQPVKHIECLGAPLFCVLLCVDVQCNRPLRYLCTARCMPL